MGTGLVQIRIYKRLGGFDESVPGNPFRAQRRKPLDDGDLRTGLGLLKSGADAFKPSAND